jgi:hypothetical protein
MRCGVLCGDWEIARLEVHGCNCSGTMIFSTKVKQLELTVWVIDFCSGSVDVVVKLVMGSEIGIGDMGRL